jgi:hypothetical protein
MKQDLNPLSSQLTAAPKILKRRCRSVEWHRRHPMDAFGGTMRDMKKGSVSRALDKMQPPIDPRRGATAAAIALEEPTDLEYRG